MEGVTIFFIGEIIEDWEGDVLVHTKRIQKLKWELCTSTVV